MISYQSIPRPLKYVGIVLPVTCPIVAYLERKRITGSRREAWEEALTLGTINTVAYTSVGLILFGVVCKI